MTSRRIFLDAIRKNHSTLTRFIETAIFHNGKLNPANLFRVIDHPDGTMNISRADGMNPDTRSVVIGIEPCNSYSPLYELDYFLMGMFLSIVATALPLSEYREITDQNQRSKRIEDDLLKLDEADIELAFQSPKVAIVGILTDDIEPYRYRKNQLWKLSEPAMKKRCIDVTADEIGKNAKNYYNLKGILWTEEDEAISRIAIDSGRNLCETKIIQSYLTIKRFLGEMDIDIKKLPFLFSFSPNNDVRTLGSDCPLLDLLLELHSSEQYYRLRKLLNWNYPRFFQVSCPNCGESSKKIINGQIKGPDKRLMRLVCSEKEKRFRNEFDIDIISKKGCNHRWDLQLPPTAEGLYGSLVNGFGLYFPVNSLIWIINGISVAPTALLFTDAGFYMKKKAVGQVRNLPIGDHPELLIHMVVLQRAFLRGEICPDTCKRLKERDLLVNSEPLLLGHQSPTSLLDLVLCTMGPDGQKFHITDSSVFAAIKHGSTPEEILAKSLNIVHFPTEKLIALDRGSHDEKPIIPEKSMIEKPEDRIDRMFAKENASIA